jgi:transcriptional regulator with XRE-family HTH domain
VRKRIYNDILFTNILRLLDEKNISREQLARISGVSSASISHVANGTGNPSLKIIEQIADALETPLPELLETDLDDKSFEILAERKKKKLPEGYARISAILPERQVFIVKKWAETARKKMKKNAKNEIIE